MKQLIRWLEVYHHFVDLHDEVVVDREVGHVGPKNIRKGKVQDPYVALSKVGNDVGVRILLQVEKLAHHTNSLGGMVDDALEHDDREVVHDSTQDVPYDENDETNGNDETYVREDNLKSLP